MAARAHDWVNRGRWVVEVEGRMMSGDTHLRIVTLDLALDVRFGCEV